MKSKFISFFALTILVGAFLLPASALAGGGVPPPSGTSQISGLPTPVQPSITDVTTTGNPLTPDGTATVLDNATDTDGKEFFTFQTPNGNVFFLVIDRSRPNNNVYFLNAVTERDLLALAENSDDPPFDPVPTPLPTPEPNEVEPEPEIPEVVEVEQSNNGTTIFIVVAAVVFGGAAYYFKTIRPKKQGADFDDEDDEDDEDDDFDDLEFEDESQFNPKKEDELFDHTH